MDKEFDVYETRCMPLYRESSDNERETVKHFVKVKVGKDKVDYVGRDIYWLDELLDGGLRRPKSLNRPLLILLTGQPGAGKSLLAQQILYHHSLKKDGNPSVYLTFEASAMAVVDNLADSLRFSRDTMCATELNDETIDVRGVRGAQIQVLGGGFVARAVLRGEQDAHMRCSAIFEGILEFAKKTGGLSALAVDGINVVEDAQAPFLHMELARWLIGDIKEKIPFVFLVEDLGGDSPRSRWEYIADVVIGLEKKTDDDYERQFLSIKKARFQEHVLGDHLFKVYGVHEPGRNEDLTGARPILHEGGAFLFPNVNFWLSECRRDVRRLFKRQDDEVKDQPWPWGAGGPEAPKSGDVVVLVGGPGSRRRALAADFLIDGAGEAEGGLVISFGDTSKWFDGRAAKREIKKDHVKQMLQRPGRVTAHEFVHRVAYWIAEKKPRRAMIVGYDELESLFPLLFKEPLFVPCLIELLKSNMVTTFVVASKKDRTRLLADHVLEMTPEESGSSMGTPETFCVDVLRLRSGGWVSPGKRRFRATFYEDRQPPWKIAEWDQPGRGDAGASV